MPDMTSSSSDNSNLTPTSSILGASSSELSTSSVLTIPRQATQGFLVFPWVDKQATLGTPFSTLLAAKPNLDPYLHASSPFDLNALNQAKFVYLRHNSCNGTYVSTTTTSAGRTSEHLSISLGISIGNEYLGASVVGGYDRALLNNKSSGKMSRRASFRAGTIRFFGGPPPLIPKALNLLSANGIEAFTATYGDYYVGGITLGGDAGVLVSQEIDETSSAERLKVEVSAQFLCFSTTETLADEVFISEHQDLKFGITAFDTLSSDFVELPQQLGLEATRRLGAEYGTKVEDLAERVGEKLEPWENLLEGDTKLGWDDVRSLVATGMAVELVLLPFSKLREVRPYAMGIGGGGAVESTPAVGVPLVVRSRIVEGVSA